MSEDNEKEEKKYRLTWREFWSMLGPSMKKYRGRYVFVTTFIVIASLAQVAEPIIYGRIIDVIFVGGDGTFSRILPLIAFWAGTFLLSIGLSQSAQLLGWWIGNHASNDFMHRALGKILFWDADRFGRSSSGAIAKRLDKAWERSFDVSGRMLSDVLPSIVTFVCVMIAGILLDWRMTVAALVTVPVAAFLTFRVYLRTEDKQSKLSESWEELSASIHETIMNILPIKIFSGERRIEQQQTAAIDNVTARQNILNYLWAFLAAGNGVVRLGSRIVVLVVGVWLIADGSLTVGKMVTFLGMLNYILAPFDYLLADVMRRMGEARAAFSRLAKDWFEENAITEVAQPKRLKDVRGDIRFEAVRYRYPGKKNEAIQKTDLHIPAGTSLALVGRSGSGKSTFVKFLNRFLDPASGRVTIDGIDIKIAKMEDLRRAVGIVQQDTVLFNDSVLNNIRFAQPKATKEEVITACKKAQAHEFIKKLPKGYDTIVGERGVKLSGGERQRISLARVFLSNPPILVLDESTSALDSETESRVQEALGEVMKGRTTIVIAHRLSTVYMADTIVVLESGKIVEKGTHDELLESGGVYDRLWKLQSGGYLPE
jgi:ABC-type multidrug transport system fused ATPase/permease subunit